MSPDTRPLVAEAIRRVVRMRSGTPSAADQAELAAWRAAAPENERAFRRAQRIWDSASSLEQDPASGLMRIGTSQRPAARPATHYRRFRQWGLAASVVAIVWTTAWLGTTPTLFSDYAANTGATRTVPLADHSTVTLDATAAVNVRFDETARKITLLSGKAFFEVMRDEAARPFQVLAGDVTVTARGTAFEVERFDDGGMAVAVSEHTVSVRSSRGDEVFVTEGQRLRIDATGMPLQPLPIRMAQVASWREGHLVADDQPLSEVIEALSHHYRGWILVRDNCLDGRTVSARLNLKDPRGSLRIMEQIAPVRVTEVTPFVVVISPTSPTLSSSSAPSPQPQQESDPARHARTGAR